MCMVWGIACIAKEKDFFVIGLATNGAGSCLFLLEFVLDPCIWVELCHLFLVLDLVFGYDGASNLVEYLDDIKCVATNGTAICFLRPFPQTFIVQNMITGFDQSNRLLNGCGAGMGSWQVCGRGRHCTRILKILVNTRVRYDIQVLQTDNALVSHADG